MKGMVQRLRVIIRKEFLQALRNPRMRAMLVAPPVMQLLVFGFAANLDVDAARLAWVDEDRTAESRELFSRFQGSGRFDLVAAPDGGADEARDLLDRGGADAAVRVPAGFGEDVRRGRGADVQVLVDGANSNTASIVAQYAASAVARYAEEAMERSLRGARYAAAAEAEAGGGSGATGGAPSAPSSEAPLPRLVAKPRVWFNSDLRSRNYFVPGILVNIITLTTMMLTAMAVVREKEVGTMEQLLVTPVRPVELMLGKTLPFALIGLFNAAVAVTVSVLLFRVPLRGSVLFLGAASAVFLMSTLGAGLFISTVSRTQQQAMMTMFLVFMPFFLLSGFAFPIRNMPPLAQWITLANPVRYFVEIARGVFLKGVGAGVLWPQLLALAAFGAAILAASVLRFKKKLD